MFDIKMQILIAKIASGIALNFGIFYRYKGSRVNILTLIVFLFIAVPVVGMPSPGLTWNI